MSPRRTDRWYSIEGQRRIHRSAMESSKGPRHLISLVVLLALTLIAMQQVSNPQRVERVARAVGLLQASSSQASSASLPSEENAGGSSEDWESISRKLFSADPVIETQAQIVERLLDTASHDLVSGMAYDHLIASEGGLPRRNADEKELQEWEQWLRVSKEQVVRWTELSDSNSPEHAALSRLWQFLDHFVEPGTELDLEFDEDRAASYLAFRLAMERTLLSQFSDNTPWRTSDRFPLMRATQRAVGVGQAMERGELEPETLPAIAVPQLMGDTQSLRGRAVRIAGRINLVDRTASLQVEDPRINEYGVLWLQPDDGSNQPIVVHVPTFLAPNPEDWKPEREILVSGIVTKKRAYASKRGGEIAPVLVAAHIQPFQPGKSGRMQPTASDARQPSSMKRWIPPVDIQGALERIEQRIGPRIESLQTRLETASLDRPDSVDALARDPSVQATLDGLHRVIDDVQLVANPNNPWRKTQERRIRSYRGWVTDVRRIPIEKEPFPGWPWPSLFVCRLEAFLDDGSLASGEHVACAIVTQHVPSQWLGSHSLRQPAIVSGLALDFPGKTLQTFLISPDIQWRTRATAVPMKDGQLSPMLSAGWVSLLANGWNLSWIDMIEGLQGKAMTSRESEPFYGLLGCSAPTDDLVSPDLPSSAVDSSQASQVLSVMQAIQRAETRKTKGDVPSQEVASSGYRIQGTVEIRRIQRVSVRNPAEQQWLDADHYYQLDGFADIGNSRITIRFDESQDPIVFEKEFPVTLVSRKVPDSLLVDAGNVIEGELQAWYPRSRLAVSGWFYRMWRFKTTQVSEATGGKEAQQGPLIVVDRFDLASPRRIAGASNMSARWVGFLTMTIGILGGLWILHHIRRSIPHRGIKR